jgi:hypothetical protein
MRLKNIHDEAPYDEYMRTNHGPQLSWCETRLSQLFAAVSRSIAFRTSSVKAAWSAVAVMEGQLSPVICESASQARLAAVH